MYSKLVPSIWEPWSFCIRGYKQVWFKPWSLHTCLLFNVFFLMPMAYSTIGVWSCPLPTMSFLGGDLFYMFVSFGTPSRPRTRWMIPVGLRWFTGSNHLDRMKNMSWNWKLSLSLYIYIFIDTYVYESNTFKLYFACANTWISYESI